MDDIVIFDKWYFYFGVNCGFYQLVVIIIDFFGMNKFNIYWLLELVLLCSDFFDYWELIDQIYVYFLLNLKKQGLLFVDLIVYLKLNDWVILGIFL